MKKNLLLSLTFSALTHIAFGQADIWSPIVTNGFGTTQQYNVQGFVEFKDTLYVSAARKGISGSAEVYRSGTGDVGSWGSPIIYDSSTTFNKGIPAWGTTSLGGGLMWMATGNQTQGTKVYRTQNGTSWIPISNFGFGNPLLWSPTPNMVLFQGTGDTIPYLYAGGNSHGGPAKSQVWRTPYTNTNPSSWNLIVDFNIRDTNVTQVTYFYVWNNKLYFGTNGDSLLYESTDGINFIANTGVATSFLGSDLLIACLIEYNGILYAGTNNQSPLFGGQLYRTPDGITWTNITALLTAAGRQASVDEELHDIDTANGYLWITPYTDTVTSTSGMPVWHSTDNTVSAFVQSNLDGFGNPNIDGENPSVSGFKGREYFGGPNFVTGGQIWRTDVFTGIIEGENESCKTTVFPNPFSYNATIRFDIDCGTISQLLVYDLTGKLILSLENTTSNEVKVEKNNLNPGMYFYQIHTETGKSETGKFIIE